MRKTIVCVFAHPDDEAFGPSGTIATLAKDNDVYILCATRGEAGQNESGRKDPVHAIREEELKQSGEILGVKKVIFLDFQDGTLCNNLYHKLAENVQYHVEHLKADTLLTYERQGISGHIDHITVSMVTTYVFYKVDHVKTLMYYCLDAAYRQNIQNYFIYFPPGYNKKDIDMVVDISPVWETKLKAIKVHKTQQNDINRILERLTKIPKEENFLILKK